MKRRIALSIALALCVLALSPGWFDSTTQAQPPQRFRTDSGVVTPAVGQTLRVTVASARKDDMGVSFRWMQYGVQSCAGAPPVCRHMVVSQGATTPMVIDQGETLTFDVQGTGAGVRVMVDTNSPNARVVFIIFDTSTQRVVAAFSGDAYVNELG